MLFVSLKTVSLLLQKSLNETFGADKYSEARKEVLTNMFSRPMQVRPTHL